ncbi:Protein CBG04964 [Caenorhabditis briggsae]|uniref:Protein CBG04964 n=1 Tax=Caenorhabditis briggsae TaxID=6238 RepID=A8WYW7_CAEBR|nr:Protein CBG04964 [Caenorhabditis briggsae]CAP25575.2 Protein CBG04964 [Caenorhabditis briggsae]
MLATIAQQARLIEATLCQSTLHGYEDLLEILNFERGWFAERMNISNMYELNWDETLNPNLWPEFRAPNSSFREMLIGRDQNAIAAEVCVVDQLLLEIRNDPTFFEKMKDSIDRNHWPYWPFEHMLPTQTGIACESRERMYNWSSPWKGSSVYRTICSLGSKSSFKNSVWKFGAPGSGCGNDKVEDGLCVGSLPEEVAPTNAPPPTTTSISPPEELKTTPTLIKAASEGSSPEELRTPSPPIEAAMEVANMFKLVWNASGTLKLWIDSLENNTVTTLEQFVPTQTEIGCAPFHKAIPMEGAGLEIQYSTICVLTPTSSFKDAETKTGPAGSECGGCQVEDGLCVQTSGDGELQCLP